MPPDAAVCRSLQGCERNDLFFFCLRSKCMIGDLGVVI
jgi:hypothetical protein